MPTDAKRETVAELREELARSRTMIVSEYRGLTVREIAEIRRALRKQDVSYRVVKNRLMLIAAKETVGEALGPLLTGPTAIAFGTDEASTAKAVIDAPGHTRSSGSPAASSAIRRSTRTGSPAWRPFHHGRSSWPSWPARSSRRRRSSRHCSGRTCATSAMPSPSSVTRRPPRAPESTPPTNNTAGRTGQEQPRSSFRWQ